MHLLVLTAGSFLVSLMTIMNPIVRNANETQDLPLQIAGIKNSLDCLGMLIIPDHYAANKISVHWPGEKTILPSNAITPIITAFTTTITATNTVTDTVTDTITATVTTTSNFIYDASLSYWQNALEWCRKWFNSLNAQQTLALYVFATVSVFLAIMQWNQNRKHKQDWAYFHKMMDAKLDDYYQGTLKQAPTQRKLRNAAAQELQEEDDTDANIDDSYQADLEQEGLTQGEMIDAAQELQGTVTRVHAFRKQFAGLRETADMVEDSVEKVRLQVNNQLATLESQEDLQSRVEAFENSMTEMKDSAEKALMEYSEDLQTLYDSQVCALDLEERMENLRQYETELTEMKATASEAVENIKQLNDTFQEQATKLPSGNHLESFTKEFEEKSAELVTLENKAASLLKQVQDHATAIGQEEENVKARKKEFYKNMDDTHNSAVKLLNERYAVEMEFLKGDFRKAEVPAMNKKYADFLSQENRGLANQFRKQVMDSFRQNFSKQGFDELIREVLTEQLQSALPGMSSGDLASFLLQKHVEAGKEHTGSQLPSASSALPRATTTSPGEALASPGLPSSETKLAHRTSTGSLRSAVRDPPFSPTLPQPQNQGKQPAQSDTGASLQDSMHARPTSPEPQSVDKGKRPIRRDTGAAAESSKASLQDSMHARSDSPVSPQPADKGKKTIRSEAGAAPETSKRPSSALSKAHPAPEVQVGSSGQKMDPGVQGSRWAKPDPKASSGTVSKIPSAGKIKGEAKESASKKGSAQQAGAQSSSKKDTQDIASVAQNLKSIPQTASVSPVSEMESKSLPSSSSASARPTTPDTPKPPVKKTKKPPPRAGLVEENLDDKDVVHGPKSAKWPPLKDNTKADSAGPSTPKSGLLKLWSVKDEKKSKETSGPAGPPEKTSKSESWASEVEEEEPMSGKGPSGAKQLTGATATAATPAATEETTRPASVRSTQEALSGASQSDLAPQARTESPNPPEGATQELPPIKDTPKLVKKKVSSSSGTATSRWANPETPKEEIPKLPSEPPKDATQELPPVKDTPKVVKKKVSSSSGTATSRWANPETPKEEVPKSPSDPSSGVSKSRWAK